ncbi:uncharacterized protein V1518DRAFT_68989 [Limtongia smithiae]|uniref:uncharacterized protein n=1 Tax=Limtongia smithiae TaxID=1125753 RepID=UPI0034CD503C
MSREQETFIDDTEDLVLRRLDSAVLTDKAEIIDIRCFQRTYEGAYLRTYLLEVTLALSLLRVFDIEFYPIGAAFVVIGVLFMIIALRRRLMANEFFISNRPARYFLTSGTPVLVMTILCIIAYIAIIPEIFRLK